MTIYTDKAAALHDWETYLSIMKDYDNDFYIAENMMLLIHMQEQIDRCDKGSLQQKAITVMHDFLEKEIGVRQMAETCREKMHGKMYWKN